MGSKKAPRPLFEYPKTFVLHTKVLEEKNLWSLTPGTEGKEVLDPSLPQGRGDLTPSPLYKTKGHLMMGGCSLYRTPPPGVQCTEGDTVLSVPPLDHVGSRTPPPPTCQGGSGPTSVPGSPPKGRKFPSGASHQDFWQL